jgi:AraC-like DNA-binding protein
MSRLDSVKNWLSAARSSKYSSQRLAKKVRVSSSQLRRYFTATFFQTPQEWLDQIRLFDAMRLLASGITIKEATFSLGYFDSAHFCHHFKRFHGCTPNEFLKINRARRRKERQSVAGFFGDRAPTQFLTPPPWKQGINSLLSPINLHSIARLPSTDNKCASDTMAVAS